MPYPHAFIKLTKEERRKIKSELQRLLAAGLPKKRKPLQMLYFSDIGKTFKAIAKYLDVDYRTVKRWISAYRKDGLAAFIKG